jgi:putative hemolysin
MKKYLILICLGSLFSMTASATRETGGIGNPAAKNCILLGGRLEMVVHPDGGQDANCVIEEWKLFSEMNKRHLVHKHQYDGIRVPNPASVNCADIKGTLRMVATPQGQYGLCVVGEWNLFRAINIINEK